VKVHDSFSCSSYLSSANLTNTRSERAKTHHKEHIMGFLEEAAGAFAAVEAEKKLNPEGGVLAEGAAAVAGFGGVEAIENLLEKKEETPGQ
jgi:hypothetical protein